MLAIKGKPAAETAAHRRPGRAPADSASQRGRTGRPPGEERPDHAQPQRRGPARGLCQPHAAWRAKCCASSLCTIASELRSAAPALVAALRRVTGRANQRPAKPRCAKPRAQRGGKTMSERTDNPRRRRPESAANCAPGQPGRWRGCQLPHGTGLAAGGLHRIPRGHHRLPALQPDRPVHQHLLLSSLLVRLHQRAQQSSRPAGDRDSGDRRPHRRHHGALRLATRFAATAFPKPWKRCWSTAAASSLRSRS